MLIAAGLLFLTAALLWFVDSWVEDADVDLTPVVRLLLFISVLLVGMNVLSH